MRENEVDKRFSVNARQGRVIGELLSMAYATLAYCEDDSRSPRRRQMMIRGAREAIEIATGVKTE